MIDGEVRVGTMSATRQRKQASRLRRAWKLATTWRVDTVFRSFEAFDDPDQAMAVHERHCAIMVALVCTCRPVLVHPPVAA